MKLHILVIKLMLILTFSSNSAFAGELYVFTSGASGFHTHSIWYDDGHEVTVVDSQFTPALARALVADIKKKSDSPITRVVVTHPNPDKFNALSVFHNEGAESIASAKTAADIPEVDAYKRYFWVNIAKAFTSESYPKIEPVKTTYESKKIIKLKSGETITLFELQNPGVSSNQTVVRIDKTGDLIVGDLIHTKNHAWLEGGIVSGSPTPTIEGWKKALRELAELGDGKVYGGRGEFVPVKQAVASQVAYLNKADSLVANYIESLGARKNELTTPAKQDKHFKAIENEFVKAFPDYAMPNLIGYSVYGLTQQKLTAKN